MGFKRSKQTQLFADADTIISVHHVICDVYQSRLKGTKLASFSEEETTGALADVLRAWVQKYGIPRSIYTDWTPPRSVS